MWNNISWRKTLNSLNHLALILLFNMRLILSRCLCRNFSQIREFLFMLCLFSFYHALWRTLNGCALACLYTESCTSFQLENESCAIGQGTTVTKFMIPNQSFLTITLWTDPKKVTVTEMALAGCTLYIAKFHYHCYKPITH